MHCVAIVLWVALLFVVSPGPTYGQEAYGKYKVETKGRNPARLKWEDVSKVYEQFKKDFSDRYHSLRRETHGLFHDEFSQYFPRLEPNVRSRLLVEYSLLFAGDQQSLKDSFTYEEVFQIGQAPSDILFPICFTRSSQDFQLQAMYLKGITLRGKAGEEKGIIEDVTSSITAYDSNFGLKVRTPKGDLKDESGWSPDALTARYADIRSKILIP